VSLTVSTSTQQELRRVAVLGLGNVGHLVSEMLAGEGFDVVGADANPSAHDGAQSRRLDAEDAAMVGELLDDVDAVVSCLPYRYNARLAELAAARGVHYLDLTEDVPTSRVVQRLAADAPAALIPHCGLAPGYICILGGALERRFDAVDRLALRVGALPAAPNTELGYAFTWSPAGVVNEYLNACEALDDGRIVSTPPLSDLERVVIEGQPYEAFTTSGGLATMCETFEGKVRHIDYKTIRYPGHCALMRFLLQEMRLGRDRANAERLLSLAYPPVDEDVVIVYAAAEGELDGRPLREELTQLHRPRVIGGSRRTAIAWTTAAGAVGVLQLLAAGELPQRGFIRQEDIPLDAFLSTPAGSLLDAAAQDH
jgi:saccharopine dehydrogenase-like NADP-dependent oxidoreductase